MLNLAVTLVLACAGARASAEPLGPTSQTLEALRGASVDGGDAVFDGYERRIRTLTPVEYAPLPTAAVPRALPVAQEPVTFDSHRAAPGVIVHAPRERVAPQPASTNASRAGGYAAVGLGGVAVAAGLVAGGGLLLPLAGVGAALIVLGAYFLLRS